MGQPRISAYASQTEHCPSFQQFTGTHWAPYIRRPAFQNDQRVKFGATFGPRPASAKLFFLVASGCSLSIFNPPQTEKPAPLLKGHFEVQQSDN